MKITAPNSVGSTPGGSGGGGASGPAGGDLGGTFPGPSVTGLQGTPVCVTAPTTGDVLTFNGTEWCPASIAGPGSFLTSNYGEQAQLVTTGAAGAVYAIDCSLGNTFDITLTANCTLSIINPAPSGVDSHIVVILRQGGTGSYTVTWPGSVVWQDPSDGTTGGPAPTLWTVVGAQNDVELSTVDGGTTWGGDPGGGGGSGPAFATPAIVLGTAAAAGAAATVIRSDSTIVAFDATVPTTIHASDAAATGSAAVASRRDHGHGIGAFVGAIIISDTPSTPLVFADLIQNDTQTDLVYADT